MDDQRGVNGCAADETPTTRIPSASDQIPLIILGGSDRAPVALPSEGSGLHPLSGYKGVDIQIAGRPMIEIVIERVRASQCLAPVYVAGPARVYGPVIDPEALIDTNCSFGQNIQQSLDAVVERHPGQPVAFMTCDVLPEAGTLQRLIAEYRKYVPCDLWFPLIPAPVEQVPGASAWKPKYRIVPEPGQEAVAILPGHLVVIDPSALRHQLIYNVFQIAYATRNRPIAYRRNVMLRKLLLQMLYQDLQHVLGLRLPTLTWTVITAGVSAAGGLQHGTILQRDLEHNLRALLVKTGHRRRYPERRVVLSMIDELSLALDIDTEEEVQSITATAAP